MREKKKTNFGQKRELRLHQESFYEMGNDQELPRQKQANTINQTDYIEQLQNQIAELNHALEEQKQLIEAQEQELDDQKQTVQAEQQKVDELNEQYLRLRADLENSRRRARNEKEQALKYAVVPLLESLLPVLDNFERALHAADTTNQESQLIKEGVEMVYRHFMQVLSESKLSVIEALGKPFDPHIHNAVMQVEHNGVESGIVVEELQTGYHYLDRVVRPTMVKVSK